MGAGSMVLDAASPRVVPAFLVALTLLVVGDAAPGGRSADQERLKPWGGLVGDWRGAGQPQRGSNRGAWAETGKWAWKLTSDSAALELQVQRGKLLKSATLRPGTPPDTFRMTAVLADGSSREFSGRATPSKPVVLVATEPKGDGPSRVTLTIPNEARSLLLFEAKNADSGQFYRLAEVGYTKQGVAFAASGESGPICIVTEGKGTIPVSYQGKTYYVCCSGCKDLFNENPAAVLAEYEAKQKAKK